MRSMIIALGACLSLSALAGCPVREPAPATGSPAAPPAQRSQTPPAAPKAGDPGTEPAEIAPGDYQPSESGKPRVADYASGKAGREVVVVDGVNMPQGWPIPSLGLPPDAAVFGQPEGPLVDGGGAGWLIRFSCPQPWTGVTAHVDAALKPLGYQRVISPLADKAPQLDEGGKAAVGFSEGKRTYRSSDGLTIVYLSGEFRKGASAGAPSELYTLNISYYDVPTQLGPDNRLENL